MKYVKILGLLAVAAAAMMAFAASASADIVTSPTGSAPFTGEIVTASEGHATLHNPIAKIECAGTATGKIEQHPDNAKVSGIVHPTFTGCTNSWHVTTTMGGTIKAEWNGTGYNGTAYSDGATIEATRFGITCRYITSTTKIGTITGGSSPTMHIEAKIPFHNGSPLCGTGDTVWTGSYGISKPTSGIFIDNK